MRHSQLVALAVLLVLGSCTGGGRHTERGEGNGDAERAASTLTSVADTDAASSALQTALDELLEPDEPGCVVALGEGGNVRAIAARGLADLESGSPLSEDTIFDYGSVSKQFTGALLTLLAGEGTVDLDAPLSDFIDGLAPSIGAVTVDQLLVQTSGLPDYEDGLEAELTEAADNDDVVTWLHGLDEPSFAPGSRWEYSNDEVAGVGGGGIWFWARDQQTLVRYDLGALG